MLTEDIVTRWHECYEGEAHGFMCGLVWTRVKYDVHQRESGQTGVCWAKCSWMGTNMGMATVVGGIVEYLRSFKVPRQVSLPLTWVEAMLLWGGYKMRLKVWRRARPHEVMHIVLRTWPWSCHNGKPSILVWIFQRNLTSRTHTYTVQEVPDLQTAHWRPVGDDAIKPIWIQVHSLVNTGALAWGQSGREKKILFYLASAFYAIQAFRRLDEAHSQWGGQCALPSLLIQMLISFRNTLIHTPRNNAHQLTGYSWPELTYGINLVSSLMGFVMLQIGH